MQINKLIAASPTGICYALVLIVFAAEVFSKEQNIAQAFSDLPLHILSTGVVLLFVFVIYKMLISQ